MLVNSVILSVCLQSCEHASWLNMDRSCHESNSINIVTITKATIDNNEVDNAICSRNDIVFNTVAFHVHPHTMNISLNRFPLLCVLGPLLSM